MSEILFANNGSSLKRQEEEEENFIEKKPHKTIEQFETSDSKYAFNGLTREQLEKYGLDPNWRRIRWIIAIGFWVIFTGMLTSALLLIIFTQKCAPIKNMNWFESSVVYRIDVTTFKDTNNDGKGDYGGVSEKIFYLKSIGINTVLLDNLGTEQFLHENEFENLIQDLKSNEFNIMLYLSSNYSKNDVEKLLKMGFDGIEIKDEAKDNLKDIHDLFKKATKSSFKEKILILLDFKRENVQIDTLSNALVAKSKNLVLDLNSTYSYYDINQWPILSLDTKNIYGTSSHFGILLLLTLRGTPQVHQGNEIGLYDHKINWDTTNTCGFSTLPINETYTCDFNVQWQSAHGSGDSPLKLFKELTKIRKEPSFQWGELTHKPSGKVFSYTREANRFNGYLIAFNSNEQAEFNNFYSIYEIPLQAEVVLYQSTKSQRTNGDFLVGSEVSTDKILLKNGEILILKYSRFEATDKVSSKNDQLH